MSELLPCPFCGGSANVKHIGNEYVKKQVCEIACTTFGCFAHQRVGILNGRGHTYAWAEQKCRGRWNTRAPAQLTPAELDAVLSAGKYLSEIEQNSPELDSACDKLKAMREKGGRGPTTTKGCTTPATPSGTGEQAGP